VFTVDGVATNSLIYGSSRQNTVFEYLQEVQVKTGGIDAEYGGALGGVISAVTKSGGNRFTGESHYYYIGNALSAGPVKRLVLDPTNLTTVGYFQDEKPANNQSEFGGSIGGPIVRNRLFFSDPFRRESFDGPTTTSSPAEPYRARSIKIRRRGRASARSRTRAAASTRTRAC
jgi:hypothetical protein